MPLSYTIPHRNYYNKIYDLYTLMPIFNRISSQLLDIYVFIHIHKCTMSVV